MSQYITGWSNEKKNYFLFKTYDFIIQISKHKDLKKVHETSLSIWHKNQLVTTIDYANTGIIANVLSICNNDEMTDIEKIEYLKKNIK